MIRSANFAPGSPAALVAAKQAKRPGSSAAHRKSVQTGAAYEDQAERLNRECALAGVAFVEKVNSHLRIVGGNKDGSLKARVVRKSCLDVRGWLSSGRAVAIEVKGTPLEVGPDRKPLPVSFPLANVKPHQVAELDRASRDGVLTLLLVVHGLPPLSVAYAVPWEAVVASGKRTLDAAFLEPWRCKPGQPYLARFLQSPSPRPENR